MLVRCAGMAKGCGDVSTQSESHGLPRRFLAEWTKGKPVISAVLFCADTGICYRHSKYGGLENFALGAEGRNVFETVDEARKGAEVIGRRLASMWTKQAKKALQEVGKILAADCSKLEPIE